MTEIIMCRSCKEQISINAEKCPYCGQSAEKKLRIKKIFSSMFGPGKTRTIS